jgi:serine protease
MIKELIRFTFLIYIACFGAVNFSFSQDSHFEKGQIIVQLKTGKTGIEFARIFEAESELPIKEVKTLSATANIYEFTFENESTDLKAAIHKAYDYQYVIHAQTNHLITSRETIPTDTLFSQQWFHKNTGQTGGNIDADIDTPDAWDITTGGLTTHNDTIVVCIIEGSGVDISHIDLVDNIWKNYAEIPNDGIDNDNNGYIDDFNGWNVSSLTDAVGSGSHGTRVAGMVGAKGNNITGVSGVNWDVKMMIIKGQVASNESSVIAAYDYPLSMRKKYNETYGREGAYVVVTNASWGIDNGNPDNAPIWCAMYDTLGAYGILNVAATTNSNSNIDINGDLPTACPSEYLIGVTMTNSQDIRAGSGYGPIHIDLAAPGSSVLLPIPGNFYSATSGTSFASPCVAGAIALAYSAPCTDFISFSKFDPAAAALQMRNYLLSSVDVLSVLDGEVGTSGRLNVKNTIDSLLANCNPSACARPYNLHGENLTDTAATLYWDGFSSDYLVYLKEGANAWLEIPLTNLDSIHFDTLIPCTNYIVQVKGICGLDTSDFSFPFEFKTDGCCDNPNLIMNYSAIDTIQISWSNVLYGTEYDIRYREEGDVSWIATYTDTISPIYFTALDTCTAYEFQIKTLCTDSTQGFSDSYIYATKGCGACYEADYCAVVGANPNSEWIEKVVLNGFTSQTGSNNGWYQSDNILVGFIPGQTYQAVVEPGYAGFEFTERISLWIDLNHDGVFDVSEKLIDDVSTNTQIDENITIPLTASLGVTKMRVGMSALSNPPACPNSSFFGEYEDYCIYFGADAGLSASEIAINLYPNPTSTVFTIESNYQINELSALSLDGKTVLNLAPNEKIVDVSNWNAGIYILTFRTDLGTVHHKLIVQ